MSQIIKIDEIEAVAEKIHQENKKIVLVGGCFDIVHLGHMIFLEKSKKAGDVLMVLLENDKTIKRLKGGGRPINSQGDRARLLTYVRPVDYIIMLPEMNTGKDYDELINKIRPSVLAVAENDRIMEIKRMQAKMVGAKLKIVTRIIGNKSTTNIIGLIKHGRIPNT